jgi:hypothetical protein
MMTPEQRTRALVDKLTKSAAARPDLPKVRTGRNVQELMNTGAAARNLAKMSVKKDEAGKPDSLADKIRKARSKTYG